MSDNSQTVNRVNAKGVLERNKTETMSQYENLPSRQGFFPCF